jgi:GntR family transcriptional regulator
MMADAYNVDPVPSTKRTVQIVEAPALPRLRYLELADELMAEIAKGVYEIGEKLPTEAQLCARFSVSRSTVRQALGEIELAGLVERRQGSGTTLLARQPVLRYVLSVTSEVDILRYAAETVLEIESGPKPVDVSSSRRLQLGDPGRWLCWEAARRESPAGELIGLTSVYLAADYASVIKRIGRRSQRAIFEAVTMQFGLTLTRIDQAISATVIGEDEARRLQTAKGSPAIVVTRRYSCAEVGLMEVSESIHPADRFSYEIRLEREASARNVRLPGA